MLIGRRSKSADDAGCELDRGRCCDLTFFAGGGFSMWALVTLGDRVLLKGTPSQPFPNWNCPTESFPSDFDSDLFCSPPFDSRKQATVAPHGGCFYSRDRIDIAWSRRGYPFCDLARHSARPLFPLNDCRSSRTLLFSVSSIVGSRLTVLRYVSRILVS